MKDIMEYCRKLMLQSGTDYGAVLKSLQESDRARTAKKALQFTRTCEKLAFSAREISAVYVENKLKNYLESSGEIGDILFPCELSSNGIFHVKLPMFSHRTKPEKTLLHPILSKTLALYFAKYDKEHGFHRRYEKGTLAYIFSFASGTPGFDIDNLNDMEMKKTSDDILSYFLPDDRAIHCSRFHTACYNGQVCVNAFFIPDNLFLQWVQQFYIYQAKTTNKSCDNHCFYDA